MKNIAISGVSGVGKSTVTNKFQEKYKIFMEIKNDLNCNFWYLKATEGETTNHFAKEMMLSNRAAYCYQNLKKDFDISVSDRGLIDILVANEIRIKPNNKRFYVDLKKQIGIFCDELIKSEKFYDLYIVIKISYREFKRRIIKRGRKDEVRNILNDDSWYKFYFKKYYEITYSFLKKYGIKYTEIDTTDFTSDETYNKINEIIDLEIKNNKNDAG